MFKRFRKGTLIAILLCFLAATTIAHGEKTEITIAILPCFDEVMTFKKFYPLITYLKQQTGLDIKIEVPKDLNKLESAVRKADIDFVLQDPHTYVILANLFNKDSLMSTIDQEGRTVQRSMIIVRKNSGIKGLKDLKGKTVMFGPELSMTKWIAGREIFRENGINIDKDLKAYYNGGCCEDIAFNVYIGMVDAGVVCDHFIDKHSYGKTELGIDYQQMLVIGKTKGIPMRIFAAHKDLPDDIVTPVIQALLKLDRKNPAHAKILYPAELGGFQKADDKEYDDIRILIRVKQ